jgi:hypothetical protein
MFEKKENIENYLTNVDPFFMFMVTNIGYHEEEKYPG